MFFTKKRLRLYLGALLALQVLTCLSSIPIVRVGYIDFRTFFTAGVMLHLHHASALYDYAAEQFFQNALTTPAPRALPMMSPPFTALLFLPFARLAFWHAYFLFVIVNILLLVASIAVVKPFLGALASRWKHAPVLLFLTFLPAAIAIAMGQISVLLLLLYSACFVCLRSRRNFLAGLLLSLALMKFQIAIPIALLFLIWRQWRFIAGFLTGGAALTALSIRIIGLAAFVPYLRSLYSMTHTVTADPYAQLHFAILPHEMPNLYGLLFVLARGTAWSHLLILAISLAVFAFAALKRPSLPLALIAAMLVSYHLFFYDLTLLLLPLSLLADQLLRNPVPAPAPARDSRLLITQISVATLLIAPLFRFLIAADATCWLALPTLALFLFANWWPALHGPPPPVPLPAETPLELAAAAPLLT